MIHTGSPNLTVYLKSNRYSTFSFMKSFLFRMKKNPIRTTVITYKLGGGEGNKHEATDNERAWAIHLHKMKAFPEP